MFQACVAVNVEIGDMILRITQNGEFVPALVALWCAALELVGAPATSAAVACAKPPSAPCGAKSRRAWLCARAVAGLHTAMVVPAGAPLVTLSCTCSCSLACLRLLWRSFSTLPWALSIWCTSL